jgi:hypothetical protein
MVVDRHHGDDLLGIQVERQRPLDDDPRGDRAPRSSTPSTLSVSRGSSGSE